MVRNNEKERFFGVQTICDCGAADRFSGSWNDCVIQQPTGKGTGADGSRTCSKKMQKQADDIAAEENSEQSAEASALVPQNSL